MPQRKKPFAPAIRIYGKSEKEGNMFCPVCRYEYLEGVTECNDCRVTLVEVLPPEEPKEETPLPPLLKFAAPSAIIGLSYVFVVRTLNTIFPGMSLNFKLAQWNSVFNLLAQLTLLFFFVCFYYEYVQEEQKMLIFFIAIYREQKT